VSGTLVYSTCTINPSENECNIAYLLQKYPQMQLVSQYPYHIGQCGLQNTGLTEIQRQLVQRFDPVESGHLGFFITKFIKTAKILS